MIPSTASPSRTGPREIVCSPRQLATPTRSAASYFDLHYLIATPGGTEHHAEPHELGLFEADEMRAALVEVGLQVSHDAEGLMGRGLFIGRRPTGTS
jgi:hypothetical protein